MLKPATLKNRITRVLKVRPRKPTKGALIGAAFAAAVLATWISAVPVMFALEPGQFTAPHVTFKVEPQYSPAARDAKVAGKVLLSVRVGTDGKAHDIHVLRSLDRELDANAVSAVEQWSFAPGTKDGAAVEVRAQIEVDFRLLDDPK